MINYMKINKITQVKCEKCDEIRKSAIGLLSHKEVWLILYIYIYIDILILFY